MKKLFIVLFLTLIVSSGVYGVPIGHNYNKTEIDAIKEDTEGLQTSVAQDSTQQEADLVNTTAIKLDTEGLQTSITADSLNVEGLTESVTKDSTNVEAILVDTGTTLADTLSSILSEVLIIERHSQGKHRIFGKNEMQTGTVKADSTAGAWFYPFVITSAADSTLGTAIQILGADDTPMQVGMTKFDLHEVFVVAVDNATPYVLRVLWGATASAALVAGNYTDTWMASDISNPQQASSSEIDISMPRIDSGSLVWLQCSNAAGAQTISIVCSLIEYP